MAFNRPVDAPMNPAKTETIATYPSGWFLESIAFDKEGNAYMTTTFGSLFFDPGSTASTGQILKRTPNGKETVFAILPIDLQGIVGALAIAEDESVYVAVVSPSKPEVHGVWRFPPAGTGEQFAALPPDTGPNGLAFGPDGNLFLADSFRGCVWRIKTQTGEPEVWSTNTLLKPRPIVALAPGPNGLKFWRDNLYVINSDKAIIVKIPFLKDGTSGEPSIHAEGVPGDDFAVDQQGTIYATTHAFDSIMRITQKGDISVIADQTQGVLGPTAAAFGILPGDQTNLYVVTDGGLFHQRENLVPSLMKIMVETPLR
jgi:sugar lactone lactonase YvrE